MRSFLVLIAFFFMNSVDAAPGDPVSESLKKKVSADVQFYFQGFQKGDFSLLQKSVSKKYLKDFGPEARLKKAIQESKDVASAYTYEVDYVSEGMNKNEVFVHCLQKSKTPATEPARKQIIKMVKSGTRYVVDELRGSGGI